MHGYRHCRNVRHRHGMHGGHRRGYGGRRARRGDVRSAILVLLAEREMHGYEMIQELEERTGGRWRPSAGSIYPTLQLLEDEGLVSAEEVDGRRVFSLTEEGRKAAEERAESTPWDEAGEAGPHQALRTAAMQLGAAAMQVGQAGSEDQVNRAAAVLAESRKKLYAILAED
jgi:DNA-binding PadR family transcriptional regulator